jgi:hypothetical protein
MYYGNCNVIQFLFLYIFLNWRLLLFSELSPTADCATRKLFCLLTWRESSDGYVTAACHTTREGATEEGIVATFKGLSLFLLEGF